ncbi:Trafficking kinesin-binding protein 1 [Acipenser ruthenus]|uniref:Trafficking kinesin-binding protein 1 n=1 Tax=Acipenser ruthenus TaxID=7906 RepID=A0A662YPA4_ACIRT|nr:Trafficking kinesin-binding protein 1 [Acipenser ruthenus]
MAGILGHINQEMVVKGRAERKEKKCVEKSSSESEPSLLLFCLPDPVASAGPTHGTLHIPVKAAKLDATALHHKTSAIALPPSEPSDSPALACGAGVNEEHYVSEATSLEDAPNYRDAGTITDVCNSTDLPEVEIISLLEEQLPHYKLRADTIYGYDHDDWLHTPLISPDANIDLTTEQIEETLKYFQDNAEENEHEADESTTELGSQKAGSSNANMTVVINKAKGERGSVGSEQVDTGIAGERGEEDVDTRVSEQGETVTVVSGEEVTEVEEELIDNAGFKIPKRKRLRKTTQIDSSVKRSMIYDKSTNCYARAEGVVSEVEDSSSSKCAALQSEVSKVESENSDGYVAGTSDTNSSYGCEFSVSQQVRGGYSAQSIWEFLEIIKGKRGISVVEHFPDLVLFLSSAQQSISVAIKELEADITGLHRALESGYSSRLFEDLKTKKKRLADLLETQVQGALEKRTAQGKLIHCLQTATGQLLYESGEIRRCTVDFFSELFMAEAVDDSEEAQQFLQGLPQKKRSSRES